MTKQSFYILIGVAFVVVSMSNLSKFCQHGSKNKIKTVAAATMDSATVADSGAYVQYHDVDFFPLSYDTTQLIAAQARMSADSSAAPVKISWDALRDVKLKKKYVQQYDQFFEFPEFGSKVKTLKGKKVSISGYIIPMDVGLYALSRNPYAACFFCGGAGPESIISLIFNKPPKRLKTDQYLTLHGILTLNDTNVEQFMYQLMAAEIVKE
jgi:hypothetical protein